MKKIAVLLALFISGVSFSFAQQTGGSGTIGDVDPNGGQSDVQCISLASTNLRIGSRDANTNSEVSLLQDFLNPKYLSSEPTGYFGKGTLAGVKHFQSDNGLTPTGYVGVLTKVKIKNISCSTTVDTPPITPVSPIYPPVMCTKDAKFCEDGSYVGRSGPNCEFVCPKMNMGTTTGPVTHPICLPGQTVAGDVCITTKPPATSTTTGPVLRPLFCPPGSQIIGDICTTSPKGGGTSARIGQTIVVNDISITPLALMEDSRCPTNVQCFSAGIVSVYTELKRGGDTQRTALKLGTPTVFGGKKVILQNASLLPQVITHTGVNDYEFTFEVTGSVDYCGTSQNGVGGCVSTSTPVNPIVTAMCDYAAPPEGCRYVRGPNYSSTTQCGMVLDCSSTGGHKPTCLPGQILAGDICITPKAPNTSTTTGPVLRPACTPGQMLAGDVCISTTQMKPLSSPVDIDQIVAEVVNFTGLKKGSDEARVSKLKSILNTISPSISAGCVNLNTANTLFGPTTEECVKVFQAMNNLDQTGIVGEATNRALNLMLVR